MTQSYIPILLLSPLERRCDPSFPLYTRILCAKFGLNCPSGSGLEDFLKLSIFFSLCCYYLPLEKGQNPSFERNWILFIQGCSVRAMFSWNWPGGSGEDNMCEQIWIDTWTDRQTINYRCLAKLTWAPYVSKYMLATSSL